MSLRRSGVTEQFICENPFVVMHVHNRGGFRII